MIRGYCGKQNGGSSKKIKIEIPSNNFTIEYLPRKKENTLTEKDTCTPVFIAVLFTIAETWR